MKTKRRGFLVVSGLVVILGALVLAGFGGTGSFCHRHMSPERARQMATVMVDNTLDRIDATDTQRDQVHAMKDTLLDKAMALHGERAVAVDEMLELWESENPDPARVHETVDARIDELRKFAHEAADSALELHQILTPEQRALVADNIRERHGMEKE